MRLNQLLIVAAIVCLAGVAPQCLQAKDKAKPKAGSNAKPKAGSNAARMQRMAASQAFLKPPSGISGGFEIAKAAPVVDFAVFPGQWKGARLWSTWGDSLAGSDGRFYGSIGDHAAPHGSAYVYTVDTKTKEITQRVDCTAVTGLNSQQVYTPGKIHGGLVEQTGRVYFWGYRGSVRQTTAEAKYRGDWLMSMGMKGGDVKNHGIPIAHCSVPVLLGCQANASLYGYAVPGKTSPVQTDRFFRYSLKTGQVEVLGGPTPDVSRAMILTPQGDAFYSTGGKGQSHFVHYRAATGDFKELKAELPGGDTLRAASRVTESGDAYCITRAGMVFSFNVKSHKVRKIGLVFPAGPTYTAACRLDPTGQYLYYLPGAHGKSIQSGTPVVQMHLKTGRVKVLAFLSAELIARQNYHTGGTFGIALNEDGSQLFINMNGGDADAKKPDFGKCAAIVVHIPASER